MGIFGIDTANVVDTTAKLNTIISNLGAKPGFIGRYSRTISGIASGLTAAEIQFLQSNTIPIVLIYNGVKGSTCSTSSDGVTHANQAISDLKALGVPKSQGYLVYCDIESNWAVTSDFIIAFYNTIISSYGCGFYAPTAQATFNNAYDTAIKTTGILPIYTPHPQSTSLKAPNMPAWNPTTPSSITKSNIAFWQYDDASWPGKYDLVQARDNAALVGHF